MSQGEKLTIVIVTSIIAFFFAFFFMIAYNPGGRALYNTYTGMLKEVDAKTNYETRKQVEDTCRAMIVSYNSDKAVYDQYKHSYNPDEASWARSAKIRANRTAYQYNDFVLKNSYVWANNVPADIRTELEIIP